MDNDKPFKTIEVVDSRTNQVCKVACMSCIRGHRTTSCGIPVCRTKVFWTVKRPGRPSNSCTCRYGATGGCKCVVARAACPHKSKKGEKRSGECRCDEFGRYCCLLDPEHWTSLLSLQKPTVDFFPTREALEEKQAASNRIVVPPTPTLSSVTSPSPTNGLTSAPAQHGRLPPISVISNPYDGFQQPMSSTLTPRFGMMGIGAPMGSQHHQAPDVLGWQGQAPIAPRTFEPSYGVDPPDRGSCCQAATPPSHGVHSPGPSTESPYPQHRDIPNTQSLNGVPTIPATVSMSQLSPAPFDFDKLRIEYFQHQFPNSICQNCGLSGCTCRNCPPIFQNFGTTSWAQCCGRKHARDVQTTPVPQKIPRTEKYDPSEGLRSQPQLDQALLHSPFQEPLAFPAGGDHFHNGYQDYALPSSSATSEFPDFDLPPDFGPPLTPLDGSEPLDLSAFLMSDLDPSSHSEPNNGTHVIDAINSGQPNSNGDDGGGSGCCCSR